MGTGATEMGVVFKKQTHGYANTHAHSQHGSICAVVRHRVTTITTGANYPISHQSHKRLFVQQSF